MTVHCIWCQRNPVAYFDGEGKCGEHAEQWVSSITNHAPILSGPPLPQEKRSPQKGVTSHTPRHYK